MCTHDFAQNDTQVVDQDTKDMLNRRRMIQALAAGGVVSVASPALSGCATNPETGSKQFLLIGDSQLSEMAATSWAEAKAKIPTTTDPRYTTRLKNIGARIAQGANKGSETWDYAVFDQDTKNAFVLPGNRVGFYRGMMDFANTDDQIAAIMGHEVGHVTGKHAAERVSQQLGGQLVVAGGSAIAGSQLAKKCRKNAEAQIGGRGQVPNRELAVIQRNYDRCMTSAQRNTQYLNAALGMGFMIGVVLPYSRKHETQSDLLGAKYMYKAGYNPYEAVKLWEKMAAEGGSRGPEFLSTHPDPMRRAEDLHNYIKYQEQLGSQGWESIDMPEES
ncbi:MAG: M48 family metallopeptidase [Hellea sp.]|nr:M48 family metallopeptidase [Hellea sp.]